MTDIFKYYGRKFNDKDYQLAKDVFQIVLQSDAPNSKLHEYTKNKFYIPGFSSDFVNDTSMVG